MFKTYKLSAALAVGLGLLLFASISYGQTVLSGAEMIQRVSQQNPKIQGVLAQLIKTSNKEGLLTFEAQLKNTTGKKVNLFWRTLWLDAQGNQVDASSWAPSILMPNQTVNMNEVAPTKKATNFRIELNPQ